MKKFIVFFITLLLCFNEVSANYMISIDLKDSDFTMSESSISQMILPKDEYLYELSYRNKQSDTLLFYLTLDSDQSELLSQIKIQLIYKDQIIYEDKGNKLLDDQYITSLKVNEKDHLKIKLAFDENSSNHYTMKQANLYIRLKTMSVNDVQTNDSSNFYFYLFLMFVSFILILIFVRKESQYEKN